MINNVLRIPQEGCFYTLIYEEVKDAVVPILKTHVWIDGNLWECRYDDDGDLNLIPIPVNLAYGDMYFTID